MTVWVPNGEEKEQQAESPATKVPFLYRVRATEQNGSCMGAVDVEPLKYHGSTGGMVAGGEALGKCVLQTVLDSGFGTSVIRKGGLRRLQR